jgi:hypothetical protein
MKLFVAYFKALLQNSSIGFEETHENLRISSLHSEGQTGKLRSKDLLPLHREVRYE